MPYGDGTGPNGTGPTGMRRGRCGYSYNNPGQNRRGMRAPMGQAEEKENLADQKRYMESVLKDVNDRLDELKKS